MIRKLLSIILLCSFAFVFIVSDVVNALCQDGKVQPRIAVLPFTDTNKSAKEDEYGEAISNMLMTKLINDKVFQVIERSQINMIIEELKLNLSGVIDSNTSKKIGEIYGVDYLVFGSVAKFGNRVETDIRLVETQSGKAELAESASSNNEAEMRSMVENLVYKIENRYQDKNKKEVSIVSNPSRASVYVDGKFTGETPLTGKLVFGSHAVKIVKPNYLNWEQTVNVTNSTRKIDAKLVMTAEYKKQLEDLKKRRMRDDDKRTSTPQTGKKSGGHTMLWILGGVVILGGVAALVLSSSSDDGDEDDNNSSVTVTVDIP
jgi:TolB-like protein